MEALMLFANEWWYCMAPTTWVTVALLITIDLVRKTLP